AFVAYHVGLNALLMALAVALSPLIEKPLRQLLSGSGEGMEGPAPLLVGAALFAATLAVLAAAAWLRRRKRSRMGAPARASPEPIAAQPRFWAGVTALLCGGAGLYFGPRAGAASSMPDTFGPEAAPLALSAALALIGALSIARAASRRGKASPAAPL